MFRNSVSLIHKMGRSWSYGSCHYLRNQCLSPLTLWVRILLRRDVLNTKLCDKVCEWLTAGRWFSLCTPVSSTNKQMHALSRDESGRFGALKSDSIHHFFRNACTKSGSLRFSQFSGCWLILSVYIIMNFDFLFVRLFGVR